MHSMSAASLAFILVVSVGLVSSSAGTTGGATGESGGGLAPWYDHDFTKKVVLLQLASDCHPSTVSSWTCKPCMLSKGIMNVSSFVNNTNGMQAYTAYDSVHHRIVVAFRGTHSLSGWEADFDFKLIPSPWGDCNNANGKHTETPVPLPTFEAQQSPAPGVGGKASGYQGPKRNSRCMIEKGFYQAYQDLQLQIRAAVLELALSYPNANVVVTGHSLGASVATNCALDLIHWLPYHQPSSASSVVDTLVTIGSPRVGNPPFARWASKLLQVHSVRSVRLVHNSDLVPKLPLASMGYLHIGNEVWYPYGHNQTTNATASEFLLRAERDLYKRCTSQYDVNTTWTDHNTGVKYPLYLGEDPQCSDSVIFQDGKLDDHMQIMGIALGHQQC